MARSTLARHRKLFSRDPEEGGGGGSGGNGGEGGGNNTETGGDGGGGNTGGDGGGGNNGGKTFTPITTQAEFDSRVSDRVRRVKAQFSDYDALKADSAELARLRTENESANEKAVREAREQAIAEERKASAPRLVGAEFRAAAKGVLTDAQRDAFLEDADLTKYLTATGEVDVEKVAKKVEALAPEKGTSTTTRVPRDLGQGNREGGGKPSVASAKDDYLERRKKQLTR